MRASFLVLVSFILLTYIYTYPGSQAVLDGRTDTMMSDGTDQASLPFAFDAILKVWHEHPSRFFYGAVYTEDGDPEHGAAYWFSWNERWLVVLNSYFVPIEQLSAAEICILFVVSGFSLFMLGRYLGWNLMVSWGVGIAWAFSCYNRARAKVHGDFVGVYHYPLIFLALFLVVRGRSKRSLAGATLALFLAGTVAHYYLITCLFLSPLFLLFLAFQPEFRAGWKRISLRMTVAVFPVVFLLGWSYFYPVPSDARMGAEASINNPEAKPGEDHPFLIFLKTYYARPLDFIAGDIALQGMGEEWNPLREMVNESILGDLGLGNAHERTNGIRWSILILAAVAAVLLARGKFAGNKTVRNNILYFLIFGLFSFWLSLSPDIPFPKWGASYWLFSIMPKVRVASRAGIGLHFGLLMVVGFFLSEPGGKWKRILLLPGLFPLLMILDYPPLQREPMAPIYPRYSALQRDKGACGLGMAFPFFSPYLAMTVSYQFSQRMRGSDCPVLNTMSDMGRIQWLTSRFPPTDEFMSHLAQNTQASDLLEKIARCVPLNWIVFHQATPRPWAEQTCQRLGWQFNEDFSCVAPKKDRPRERYPDQCGL